MERAENTAFVVQHRQTEGENYCFAEELANALGVEVKAPDDLLYIYPSGRISVGPTGKGNIVSFLPNQRERRR